MGIDEKNLDNFALDDDALDQVTGGKQKVESLVYKKNKKEKASNTLYKGDTKKAQTLLYKDDDRITLDDGPKYC